MNIFDVVIIIFIVLFIITEAKQGFIKSAVSLIGLILVFLLAWHFKAPLGNYLCKHLPFLEFSGDFYGLTSINILLYQLIAFLLILIVIFSLYRLVAGVSRFLQKIINATIILKLPSAILGGVVGFVEGYIFTFIILLCLVIPFQSFKEFNESKLVNKIIYNSPVLSSYSKSVTNSIKDIYDVSDKVINKKLTTNEANLEIVDTMLKYKVVDVHCVEQLIVLDKLDNIKGLPTVINKYK